MQALHEHASDIAHDMKNPLNGVLALSQNVLQVCVCVCMRMLPCRVKVRCWFCVQRVGNILVQGMMLLYCCSVIERP